MKAELYMQGKDQAVAILDEVSIVQFNDNHLKSPYRISYRSQRLNASKVMVELHRHEKMLLKLDDGRECNVLLQHSSLDTKNGDAVGVLKVLGDIREA